MPHRHHTPPQPAIRPPAQADFNQIIRQGIQDARRHDRQQANRLLTRIIITLAIILFATGCIAAWHMDGGVINQHGIRANRIAACQQALQHEKTAYRQLNQTRSKARTTLRQWQDSDHDPDQIIQLTKTLNRDPATPVNGDCTHTPDSLTPRIQQRVTQYRQDRQTIIELVKEEDQP